MSKDYRPAEKKNEGNEANYVTGTQALKHLQTSLSLFRNLCTLKGITPQELPGNDKTYYNVKDDITCLHHEPLLEFQRAVREYDRKIKEVEAKKNLERANSPRAKTPKPKIYRIIQQRFRRLPYNGTSFYNRTAIESKIIDVDRAVICRRLADEWEAFISRTHRLRKTFVSVKSICYQAEVEGQTITWLTPHAPQQVVSGDFDIPAMRSLLQIYEELMQPLLGFINSNLYHSKNLKYPPFLDPGLEAIAAELRALYNKPTILETSKLAESEQRDIQNENSELQHQLPSVEKAAGENGEEYDEETKQCKNLFQNVKIFLSREVPRKSMLFVILAFGGTVSWEGIGAPFAESDQSITHQIVDRESQRHRFLSREYVQPQWVFDCVNVRIILPTEDYIVGRITPPHLSPFDEEGAYVPEYAMTIKHLQAAARKEDLPLPDVEKDLEDPQNLLAEGIIDRAVTNQAAKEMQKELMLQEKQYNISQQ